MKHFATDGSQLLIGSDRTENSTMTETTKIKRLLFIDLMRFLAIFLMFIDHSFKLFYDFGVGGPSSQVFIDFGRYMLLSATFSAPLFLFLVGFSLVISYYNSRNDPEWLKRKLKRGVILILISYPLFFFQEGFSEIPFTSGILQTIGTPLIIGAVLLILLKKHRVVVLATLTIMILAAAIFLQIKNLDIQIINYFNFPLLPFLAYVFSGSIVAEGYFSSKNKQKYLTLLSAASIFVIFIYLLSVGFNPFIVATFHYVKNGFIVHSSFMAVFYIFLMILILVVLAKLENKIKKLPQIGSLAYFGKEALNIYVLHIIAGWGLSKYILRGQRFGFWAAPTALVGFMILGIAWIRFNKSRGFTLLS